MSRTAIWLANGALVVLCCFLVARIVTEVAAEALTPPPAELDAAEPRPLPVARGWDRRQVILTRNLFNVSALAPTPAEPVDEDQETYEKTRLPLVLLATVAGTPENSWAAVQDLDTREHLVVRVDDKLKERAEVIRIERRRIVLRNGGKLEELALDEEQSAAPSKRRPARRTAKRTPAREKSRSDRVERLAQNRFSVARSDVENVARNPAQLFSQARILPKYEDGQMTGVQLNAIKSGSIFEQIGIENGDVITEFNGIQVTNQQDSAKVLRELSSATEFNVTVRDESGATRQLYYELR